MNQVHVMLEDRFAEEESQADALATLLHERANNGDPEPICFQRMVVVSPKFLNRLGEKIHEFWPKNSSQVIDSFQNLLTNDRQRLFNTIHLASR